MGYCRYRGCYEKASFGEYCAAHAETAVELAERMTKATTDISKLNPVDVAVAKIDWRTVGTIAALFSGAIFGAFVIMTLVRLYWG